MGPKCIQPAGKAAIAAAFAVICLLCQPLQADDLSAAAVLSSGGRVSVIRDSTEWALFDGSTVQVGELIVTGEDGFAHLQVADGSSFTVYPNSQVIFRKNPGSLKDLLDQWLEAEELKATENSELTIAITDASEFLSTPTRS